LIDILKRY